MQLLLSCEFTRKSNWSTGENNGEVAVIIRCLVICWLWSLGQAFVYGSVTATDDAGAKVEITEPARRIVSLAPHVTELLFAAGAGQSVSGVVSYSDYPPEAKLIASVGSYQALDVEKIVSLNPDLVVAWGSGNGDAALTKLRSLGLRVFVSEPRSLEDVATNLERLGQLAGSYEQAKAVASRFREQVEGLRRRYQRQQPVSVFYQVWNQPLMTINGQHLISKVIELCGGRNIFAQLGALAPSVSVEAVLQADPQVIITGGMEDERAGWLQDWERWGQMTAVKNRRLYQIPPDLIVRHTPRIVQGAQLMCQDLQQARQDIKKAKTQ
jgi:iron complex transport system substrate-binding protein